MILDPNNLLGTELNPIVIPVFGELFQRIQTLGYDVRINKVYDTYQEGIELNKLDVRNPIFNFHTFGIAVDYNPIKDYGLKTEIVYLKAGPIQDWVETGIPHIIQELGLRWGGLFHGYTDCVHTDWACHFGTDVFQVLNTLIAMAKTRFGVNIETAQLNKMDLSNFKL